ncbi:MAG: HEAT repeat domain-containing protein [Thermodesulfovibrionales bacterium]|nr:HEAT repeat domain-containing protein [Thermodesulfovibrionales bacterium]
MRILIACVFFFVVLLACEYAFSDFQLLVSGLNSKHPQERLNAINSLKTIEDERTVELLVELLNNRQEDWRVQSRAIKLLGESKNPKSLNILLQYLDGVFFNFECPSVKLSAVLALGNFKDEPKVVDALLNNLYYDNLLIKEAVVQSLGAIANRKAVPHLISLLQESSFAIKYATIKALDKIGDPQVIPYLKSFLSSEKDVLLRREALKVIRSLAFNHDR